MNQIKSKKSLINWELVSVNPNDKIWDWKDLFCFWGCNIQSVIGFSLIASLYLVYELNIFVVLLGTLIASFLVYFLANLIGKPSQKYGLPFPVILRSSLGIKGAKYFGLFRGLVGIFMFGIQTYFLSRLFSFLIRIIIFSFESTFLNHDIFLIFLLGLNIIDWIAFIFAIFLQTFLFSKSHQFNRSIMRFSAVTVYLGMIVFFLTVFLYDVKVTFAAFADIFSINNLFDKNNTVPLITVTGTIFAYFSIIIVNFGDFSRYVKNENELKKGNSSLIINLLIFSFFAVFIVIGADIFLNKNLEVMERILTNPTDIIGKINNTELTVIVLFFIIFASVSTNLIANYVPTQNILLNIIPTKLNLKTSAIIIALFGFLIGIFWLPLLSQIGILAFIDTFGAFFGPLFGIIIVDYYIIKKTNLDNKAIFSLESNDLYFYTNGWHFKAIYSLVIGFIFAASTIWNESLMNFHSFSWIIGAFISSLTYYLLASK
ncbi:cytosine permease [Candidatus Pelagibacter sp. Uisw_134_02]|uniref:cytosine permease n=1 Tax=Candidatus Pelagibacter sp. Uisw_134_02 TaxID=3230990 RepID=UPI0039EAA2CC